MERVETPSSLEQIPLRKLLEAEAQALVEIERRKKNFPLYFYEPQEKSKPFHTSRKRLRILSGGNRSGKTHANVVEAAAYALGYRPWVLRELKIPPSHEWWVRPDNLPPEALCYNCDGVRVPVPNTVLIATGQTFKKGITETIYPKLREFLGGAIVSERSQSGNIIECTLRNRSKIYFGSAEQGPLSFESTNHTFNSIDEPVPRRVYTGISRGAVDQAAPIAMTFTPIGAWATWIFKDLYQPGLAKHPSIDVFQMSIFDNKYLPPEAVREFAEDPAMGEVEKQARLYGKFTHLIDVIYPKFDQGLHVIPNGYIPRDWFIGMVVDPHQVKPWFIAYFAITPNGDMIFFREWPPGDFTKQKRDPKSIEDYALIIRRLDGDLNVRTRLMDPNFGPKKDVIRGIPYPSVQSDIARFGLHFSCFINDDLAYGEGRVRSLLDYSTDRPLDSLNRPRLYFMEDCRNLISSMGLYTAKPRVNADGEVQEEKRDETYKDGADCVRYAVVGTMETGVPLETIEGMYGPQGGGPRDYGLGYGEAG